ncbi:transglutaminase family protein [Promethearchaeum syntrophicum]|uniref:Transglutaminase family protein n=1 Tax=Promethearchaeum syntrophicum TaxID=2594042 RepID=A0A5B9DBD2_9ARCH|nr:transglutaminase domain-containing protein [Candidatus Prometheoarchaeum syntrophicum]QEE16478.1 Transglutaminase-like superfamily protein [Candidatus Prometheoarchaeum syntrophicum]
MSQIFNKKTKAIILVILSIYSPLLISITIESANSANGDIFFNDNSSITYELTYTIEYQSFRSASTFFKAWVPRIENWSTDQTSKLISQINPENVIDQTFDEYDIYNNSYDYYYKEMEGLNGDQSFYLQYKYEITSSGFKYEIPDNITLDNYDTSSNLYQYYTSYQPYTEINDTNIMNTALNVTDGKSSLNEMIEAIYLYVVENLLYEVLPDAIGAAEALSTKVGDCSEYSSLMVALLRTVGIPARKVLGIALTDEDPEEQIPKYDVKVGDVWSYSSDLNNVPGHAWVQYYIPEIGWVSADPTWGNGVYKNNPEYVLEYLNQMDYIHLITSVGDYYGVGIEPPLDLIDSDEEGIAEIPFVYAIGNAGSSYSEISLTYDFKVIDVNLSGVSTIGIPNMFIFIGIGGGIFLLFALIGIAGIRKRNKKGNYR